MNQSFRSFSSFITTLVAAYFRFALQYSAVSRAERAGLLDEPVSGGRAAFLPLEL
jgi:hypothetical protein